MTKTQWMDENLLSAIEARSKSTMSIEYCTAAELTEYTDILDARGYSYRVGVTARDNFRAIEADGSRCIFDKGLITDQANISYITVDLSRSDMDAVVARKAAILPKTVVELTAPDMERLKILLRGGYRE